MCAACTFLHRPLEWRRTQAGVIDLASVMAASRSTRSPVRLRPMLATLADAPLDDERLVYEPKYDGIRALVEVVPSPPKGRRRQPARVTLWSRNGHDKTPQFPELAAELAAVGGTRPTALLLDGEIVALDAKGRPTSFLKLQPRIHLTDARDAERLAVAQPVVFIAFDLLEEGGADLRPLAFTSRRARLEKRFARLRLPRIWLADSVPGDGRRLFMKAAHEGWEGVIAKDAASPYHSGRRSPAWRKIKILRSQEFVIGGWTEPRQSRHHFGALIVGVFEPAASGARKRSRAGRLIYAGHVGSGFSDAELERLAATLAPLEVSTSPFARPPKGNERAHWVRPELVAQVKFTEWSDEGILRHPVYLGLRDDRPARTVIRESTPPASGRDPADPSPQVAAIIARLEELERSRKRGTLVLDAGVRVPVGNLDKVFWPSSTITKGELMRFYARISPYLLPAVADRPLVMKRFPNGVDGKTFYQHRAPSPRPDGLPVAAIRESPERPDTEVPYLIGGSLATLLYMAQLAAISQDPWFSRLPPIDHADVAAFDLDPMPGASFAKVLDVACWIHDELEKIGVAGVPKTSGSEGLHIYVPLPPDTPYEAGMLFCQIIATIVSTNHPKAATVERMVRVRPAGTVYIDYLQNIHGKTLATAYSARASAFAGVSTPLGWDEVHTGVARRLRPQAFTIRTIWSRLERVGDLWAPLRQAAPADLRAVLSLTEASTRRRTRRS